MHFGLLCECCWKKEKVEERKGVKLFNSLGGGQIRPVTETRALQRAEGRDGQDSLTQMKRSPSVGEALACREVSPGRCWHCMKPL